MNDISRIVRKLVWNSRIASNNTYYSSRYILAYNVTDNHLDIIALFYEHKGQKYPYNYRKKSVRLLNHIYHFGKMTKNKIPKNYW